MDSSAPLTRQIYSAREYKELATYACSKTILDTAELQLRPEQFCQPIDIGIDLDGDQTIDIVNMDNYPTRSAQNALAYIGKLQRAGMRAVMIRMNSPASYATKAELLARQAAVIGEICKQYPDFTVIVDPFSVALNDDKTWGVTHRGKLDYLKTVELFSELTAAFVAVGATYVLTLGRFEREVDVTRRTITALGGMTKVSSFSTNTETTNAYVYSDHSAYAITHQKILVSNYHEMVFRALIDIYEGSELVVVKPAENLHVLQRIIMLAQHPNLLAAFLDTVHVRTMAAQSPYLQTVRDAMAADYQAFARKAQAVRMGAYTVSGTYFMDMQTRDRKGAAFLKSVLHERFANLANVLQEDAVDGLIIDRNAYWFVWHQLYKSA